MSSRSVPSAAESAAKKSNSAAMALVMAGGCLWGCIGLFSRGISALGLSASAIVLMRNGGACIVLALLFLLTDRSVFRIQLRHLPHFLAMGLVSILLFTTCYFRTQQIASLAVAAILLYTAPTFVVILSAILWKDKITKRKLAALIIAFLGCTFVSGIWSGGLTVSTKALALGICSGFFYGTYSIFGRFALAHYPPFTVTFYTFLVAAVGSLVFAKPQELAPLLSTPRTVFLALGLIIVSTVLPYLLYTKGLSDLGDSGKASILASVEPVVAALVGVLAFQEPMGLGVILGLVCILASVIILR
jgi:drug/metabolite transporter (DMT)-like permease